MKRVVTEFKNDVLRASWRIEISGDRLFYLGQIGQFTSYGSYVKMFSKCDHNHSTKEAALACAESALEKLMAKKPIMH